MPAKDASEIKEKILLILKRRGPSLPVHIAKETELSILFASAFLSELLSEKKIKMSNMKIGSSPIYFISGQEPILEKSSQYLKSKEKDAFTLLKEKRIIKDTEQNPAIRVALRSIKDFAVPFKKDGEIFWRYFTIPESEFKIDEKQKARLTQPKAQQEIVRLKIKQSEPVSEQIKQKELNIFDKPKLKPKKRRKPSQKKNDKFFNKVKEFLSQKSIEILDIESFSKNDLFLRINDAGKERLLVAYNKKRINENDIIKAHKKASELNLSYIILSLGEPLKKLSNLINAIKDLRGIEKIE